MINFAYLCLKRDIKEGCWQTFSLFGEDLIAKKESGNIVVAINRCEHRGFKPAEGCGAVSDGIVCPYHGQKFAFTRRLPTWDIGEMVFVGRAALGSSMVEIGGVATDLGDEFGSNNFFVKAPFYLWVQNTADPHHLKTVHPSFAELFAGNLLPKNVLISKQASSYEIDLKPEVVSKYAKLKRKNKQKEFHSGFFHAIVMPHLSITSFLGIFYSIETAIPVDGGTQVLTRFFTSDSVKIPRPLTDAALAANLKILEEDKAIIELWAKNYRSGYNEFNKGEERVAAYMHEMRIRGYIGVTKKEFFL